MQARKLLIVDDESSLRTALFRILDKKNYQVLTASSVKEAKALASSGVDLSIVDLSLPDGNGLQLMRELKSMYQNMQFIIITGNASVESAVEATKQGAFHYLTKPFDIHAIDSIIEKALQHKNLVQENHSLKSQLQQKYRFENIVGQSSELMQVIEMVDRIADSDATVMISGESGTGKELFARAIHYNSSRAEKAIVPVNCGAIPGELLESELFGHVKGAFTGAIQNRMGRFEMADGGTLFLDEIGDMSMNLQVKLLRVLQERTFEPVGSPKTKEVDVRVIAATNVDLEKAVAQGRFREDLYYRLNVIPVHIPALRERKDDVAVLFHHFMTRFNQEKNRNIDGISPEALELLVNYRWPGNVRELENLVERLSILKGSGIISVEDLPAKYAEQQVVRTSNVSANIPTNGLDFNAAVDAYENQLIMQALEKTGWNRNQAAKLLRLNRTTLVEKIKKKGLKPEAEL
tara:strand:+ start:3490 stop:4878 length:1389 start_codon:yes stop_codon:yes gene_type:complete